MSYAARSRPVARARSVLLAILAAILAVALTAPASASASGLAGAAASTGELTGRVRNLPEELEDPSWTVCTWDPATLFDRCVPLDEATGTYAFTGADALPTGDTVIALRAWYGELPQPILGTPVTITGAGPQVLDLNVAPLLASVHGRVTDVDGSPYAGDVLMRQGSFPASRVTIAPDGSYAIKVLAPTSMPCCAASTQTDCRTAGLTNLC